MTAKAEVAASAQVVSVKVQRGERGGKDTLGRAREEAHEAKEHLERAGEYTHTHTRARARAQRTRLVLLSTCGSAFGFWIKLEGLRACAFMSCVCVCVCVCATGELAVEAGKEVTEGVAAGAAATIHTGPCGT